MLYINFCLIKGDVFSIHKSFANVYTERCFLLYMIIAGVGMGNNGFSIRA